LTVDTEVMTGVTVPIEEFWVFENGTPWYVFRQ